MRVKGAGRGQRNASRPIFTVTYYGQPMKMPESVCLGPVVKSVEGQSRLFGRRQTTSGLRPGTDIVRPTRHVTASALARLKVGCLDQARS
jgi:hypothetical protein